MYIKKQANNTVKQVEIVRHWGAIVIKSSSLCQTRFAISIHIFFVDKIFFFNLSRELMTIEILYSSFFLCVHHTRLNHQISWMNVIFNTHTNNKIKEEEIVKVMPKWQQYFHCYGGLLLWVHLKRHWIYVSRTKDIFFWWLNCPSNEFVSQLK